MAHTPRYAIGWDMREQNRWRERIALQSAKSAAYWAEEQHTAINKALIMFGNVFSLPKSVKPSASSMADYLDKTLSATDTSGIDIKLYNGFLKRLGMIRSSELELNWSLTKLMINHPLGPQPDTALKFFTYVDERRPDFFETGDDFFDIAAKVKLIRAAQVLDAAGRAEDAETLIKIGLQRYPEYFSSGFHVRQKANLAAVAKLFTGVEIVQEEGRAKLFQDDFMRRNREVRSRPVTFGNNAESWRRG